MEPMSMILAGGSLLNSIFQGNQAAALNRAIAYRNMQMQEQAAFKQNMIANRMMNMQEAGSTDARGNSTRYIPGVGWVTTPSAKTKQLTDASDEEELQRLTTDSFARRRGMQANETRRGQEGAYADEVLAEMRQPGMDDQQLFHLLRQRNREGLSRGYDDAERNGLRQAIRSRSSNVGRILSSMAERRAEGYRKADADAQIDALTQGETLRGARDARLGNKYNMFASRASNFDDTPFAPNALGGQLAAAMASRQNTAPQAFGAAISAAGATPQMDYVKPNFTTSMGLNSLADILGSLRSGSNDPTSSNYSGGDFNASAAAKKLLGGY